VTFSAVETIDVPAFLCGEIISQKKLTAGEAWSLLFDKIENEMASYMKQLDLLSHDELILAAEEISAMMTCRSELMSQGECLPRQELIFLLNEDKPLELLRNAWLDYQNVDVGEEFQNVLTGLYDQKQEQKQEPQMTM
jgi:cysteinyl-tRNA synthetase